MMNYIGINELADRITSGKINEESDTGMRTYTLIIYVHELDGRIQHTRTLAFESDNGAEDIQKEIKTYQAMGLRYEAELTQESERTFKLTYTAKA